MEEKGIWSIRQLPVGKGLSSDRPSGVTPPPPVFAQSIQNRKHRSGPRCKISLKHQLLWAKYRKQMGRAYRGCTLFGLAPVPTPFLAFWHFRRRCGSRETRAATPLGMAGIHRSSTLPERQSRASAELGMAGIHRSSTLGPSKCKPRCWLGMAGIHRSSTLMSPEKSISSELGMAGIHRSSTLSSYDGAAISMLGMAGIHRSSTLSIVVVSKPIC